MKKDRIITISIREIKNTYKRFISLLVMSLLGVCVFVGIKMAAPDMLKSLDTYYDNNNIYDIKIISTLGLTKDDINEINKIKNVEKVYGTYSYDVLLENNNELVVKVIGISNNINKIITTNKKIKDNEVLVEEKFLEKQKLKIGDTIKLSSNDVVGRTEFKIAGTVKSPLYINNSGSSSRGVTNLGTGKVNYYFYINNNNFITDYYTEIYVLVDKAKEKLTDSKEYNDLIDSCLKEINKIKEKREKERYYEIYNKINDEIIKNEQEGLNKLSTGKLALDSAKKELDMGKQKLDESKKMLDLTNIELLSNKNKLDESKKMLDDAKNELLLAKQEIDNGKKQINDELTKFGFNLEEINELEKKILEFDISKEDIVNMLPNDFPLYDEVIELINILYDLNLNDEINNIINNSITKEELIKKIPQDIPNYDDIILIIERLYDNNVQKEIKQYVINKTYIDKIIESIPIDIPYYSEIVLFLETYKENSSMIIKLFEGIKKIREAEKEYAKGLKLYNLGLEEYNNGYNLYSNYFNEYENGLSAYNNGLDKYNTNLNIYNKKIEEYNNSKKIFELNIKEAKEKLNEIPECNWYVYERLDDTGYSSFISDGQSIDKLSKVFPSIFFIVAILISLISMSRMVEEDRGLIGTLKSLGFNNKSIRKKYLIYSSLATLIGGILGSLIGFFILPVIVWNIYKMLYDVPVFSYYYDITSIIVGILIELICIPGTTLITIRKVVKEKPSSLMRPKAPPMGKRVLLEKIPFIWKNLSFSNKITIRNLFRYKKRVLMTIVGIMGCTALMLVGFGIKDSIIEVPNKQYKEVFLFDEMVYLKNHLSKEEMNTIFNDKNIKYYVPVNMSSATIENNQVNLFVVDNEEDISKIVDLRDEKTNKKLYLEEDKVIVTSKIADLIDKNKGDSITIDDTNNNEHKIFINAIAKNYVGHYIYMNKTTYEKNFSKYKTNIVYLNINDIDKEQETSKKLLKNDSIISTISINSTLIETEKTFESLNSVVLILIILSGALSFVVLYNLSNINISERKREIATLKVLGFTDKEVDNYITKETIILTVISIILGLGFGVILTDFIMKTIEINMVRFILRINIFSFVITSCMIMLFTLIVNVLIHFALKKIDMIESLKSVE